MDELHMLEGNVPVVPYENVDHEKAQPNDNEQL